jgi:hypothetical protein
MGWGMGMALGSALEKVGDIWGPQRLEEKRKAAEEERKRLLTDAQVSHLGASTTHLGAVTDSTRGAEGRAVRREPLETENLRRQGATEDARLREINLRIQDLQAELDEMPPGYRRQKKEAELRNLKLAGDQAAASANASNASARLSGATADRIGDQAARETELYAEARHPSVLARKEIADGLARFRHQVDSLNQDHLKPMRMAYNQATGQLEQSVVEKFDPDTYKQIRLWAEWLAKAELDHYENFASLQKKPAWTNPGADREARFRQLVEEHMRSLLLSPNTNRPAAGATGTGLFGGLGPAPAGS